MRQMRFRLWSAPDPVGSFQCSPDLQDGFSGPTSKGRKRKGKGQRKKGRETGEKESKI